MCTQFLRDQMVFVPELCDSRVCNSPLHKAAGTKPVGGENRLPYDEDFQPIRVVLLQRLSDCGGPPQADWSSRGH